jgi:hypothetical protein
VPCLASPSCSPWFRLATTCKTMKSTRWSHCSAFAAIAASRKGKGRLQPLVQVGHHLRKRYQMINQKGGQIVQRLPRAAASRKGKGQLQPLVQIGQDNKKNQSKSGNIVQSLALRSKGNARGQPLVQTGHHLQPRWGQLTPMVELFSVCGLADLDRKSGCSP